MVINVMKNISIWQDTVNNNDKYDSLKENLDLDVLIIGGGITGCSTFYQFKDDNIKVALVEKNRLGSGASSRSSAKLTFLQENIYTKLTNIFGKDKAHLYYKSQKEALENIYNIINKENIDCDLKVSNSYLYTINSTNIKKIEEEARILSSFNEKITFISQLPNKTKIESGFYVDNTYTFHPLKFIKEIVKKSISSNHMVYENTKIIKIEKVDDTLIKDKYEFNAINIEKPLKSIRYYNNYLLMVSSSTNLAFASNSEKMVKDLVNNTNIDNYDYIWSNYDLITLDHLPLVGFIDNNLLISTGYNTWGNTNGVLASFIIKDLIYNKNNIYQELFDPKRGFNRQKIINYPLNIFSSAYSFVDSKINKNKAFYQNNPYFTKRDGKNIAIYKDNKGIEHIVYNKCPHLKCSLVFNKVEKTWDCPCHGSRFDIDGNCIMGPSKYNIGYK